MLRHKSRGFINGTRRIDAELFGQNFLGRLFVKLLTKFGKYLVIENVHEKRTPDYVELEFDSIRQLISFSSRQIQFIWDEKVQEILIGRDYMGKLQDEVDKVSQFTVDIPFYFEYQGTVFARGIKVRYIPWMNGMVLLP